MPLVDIVKHCRLEKAFPRRTLADLYVYISYHQWHKGRRERKYGGKLDELIPNSMEKFRVKVMEQSEHVMMAGHGASVFAEQAGLELVDPSYFFTERRFESYQRAVAREKHGKVGCVALDMQGNLCAGTSTGGITNKKHGRIGDSPIIGAGTYANNATCGVSATGDGEYFIRWTVAHQISVLMQYKGYDVERAAREVVENTLVEAGGDGGVICLDTYGRPAMVTNTTGMYRAYGNSEGERVVAIFK